MLVNYLYNILIIHIVFFFIIIKNKIDIEIIIIIIMFIVIESIDLSGKTTICRKLLKHYENSVYIKLPNREGVFGDAIDKYLKNEVLFKEETIQLMFEINLKDEYKKIVQLLKENKTVICDRYIYSNVVYNYFNLYENSLLKNCHTIYKEEIYDSISRFNFDVSPDYIFLINGFHTSKIRETVERYENIEYRKVLFDLFKNVFKILDIKNMYEIDNTNNINKTMKQIYTIINDDT